MKLIDDSKDDRIKRRKFSLSVNILFAVIFAVIILLPTVLFGGLRFVVENSGPYTKWYILYCVIMAFATTGAWSVYKYLSIDRHIKNLSEAAKKVTEGDFSIYLSPRHTANDMDYIDTLYEDFNVMVEELGSIETLKNDFAANVSHELKTPLAVIQNYAQLLQATDLTNVQQEYVESINESTHRLSNLIQNILKLNKLESQKITPKPELYELCRQVSQCAIGFESVWENKNIEFEVEMEDVAYIKADAELLELVWNNLLSNAFKFTPNGGMVMLRQYSDEKDVVVEVQDTGCGMSTEVMQHSFDKFYQGDTSHSTEGNGLGLALVLRVLQMIGGTISVESEEGKGTKFTVRIPKSTLDNAEE